MSILNAVCSEYWAIDPVKMEAILTFLEKREMGIPLEFDAAVIKKRYDENLIARYSGIPVIEIYGTISRRMNMMSAFSGGTSTELLRRDLDVLMDDRSVRSVILRIDSPGGNAAGLPEFASILSDYSRRKRVIAVVDTQAASAAYWLASQCTEIVCSPSGFVGSIGAVAVHIDQSQIDGKLGIKRTIMSTSKFKTEGNPFEPLSRDAKSEAMYQLNVIHQNFVNAVAAGRNTTSETVETKFGQGRMLNAKDALAVGMIDRIASFEDVINEQLKLNELAKDQELYSRK